MNTNVQSHRINLSFAATREGTGTGDKVRFKGIAYSGGIIPSRGYMGDVAIDLSSLKNPDAQNLPVLIDHSAQIDCIAGKGALSRVGNALHITGELTQATDSGKKIAMDKNFNHTSRSIAPWNSPQFS